MKTILSNGKQGRPQTQGLPNRAGNNRVFVARAAGMQVTKFAQRRINSIIDPKERETIIQQSSKSTNRNTLVFRDGSEYTEAELMCLR